MSDEKIIAYRLIPITEGMLISNAHVVCAVGGETLKGGAHQSGYMHLSAHVVDGLIGISRGWNDRPDDFSVSIDAAHPCGPSNKHDLGRWDRNVRAREMVGNRHSKNALIDLTHWLLGRCERAEKALTNIAEEICERIIEDDAVADALTINHEPAPEAFATHLIAWLRALRDEALAGLGMPPFLAKKAKAA